MATRAALQLALVAVIVATFCLHTTLSLNVCSRLDTSGRHPARDPLTEHHGNVVALVLGKASRYASHQLIKKLEKSMDGLREMGMTETALVVIAEKEHGRHIADWRKRLRLAQLQTDNLDGFLFKSLGGKPNDVFIFDRCGRMTYFLPYERKNGKMINERIDVISQAVVTTYTGDLCSGPCQNIDPVEEEPDLLEELLNEVKTVGNLQVVTEPPTTPEPKVTPTKPPQKSKLRSIVGFLWSQVKSVFSFIDKEEEELSATEIPDVTKPNNESIDLKSLSKEKACDMLGPNPCNINGSFAEEIEYDAFCCDALQDRRTEEKCNHSLEYCNQFLLKQFCCEGIVPRS